jgi:hypothetical protein
LKAAHKTPYLEPLLIAQSRQLITISVAIWRSSKIWLDLYSDRGLMGLNGRYVAQVVAEIVDTHFSSVGMKAEDEFIK